MSFKKFIIIGLMLFSFQVAYADKKISLDLQSVNMQDALRVLAKFLNINVVISPAINGTVSLHLKNSSGMEALDLLLASHHLTKIKIASTWMISSQNEWTLHQQEKLKLKSASDEAATLVTRLWQIHYAKADDISRVLQDNTNSLLSNRGHVRVDMRTNMLCVQDIPERLVEVEKVIARLDVPVQQIVIEARLVSIDSDFERELGIDFTVHGATTENTLPPAMGHYSLAVATLADGSQLDVQLAALENEGHGELISSPSLFTANQQPASIESGEEIPYQETSLNGATSVVFKKAVLSLKVTPQILPGNKVLLQLQVNQDKPNKRMVLGVPTISTRQMSTNVLLKNGQTLVLGGIYESDQEDDQRRVPFLGNIPIIGLLFTQDNHSEKKRELLIFVTPKIVG